MGFPKVMLDSLPCSRESSRVKNGEHSRAAKKP